MVVFSFVGKKLEQLCSSSVFVISSFLRFIWFLVLYFYHYVVRRMNHFSIEVFYFLFISCCGFLILNSTDTRTTIFTPRKLDLFFTSVSAATVSSMSVIEMEVFSNTQLIIMTILMFIGGEVFTSMIGLLIRGFSRHSSIRKDGRVNDSMSDLGIPPNFHDQLELGTIPNPEFESSKSDIFDFGCDPELMVDTDQLKFKSIKFLGLLVLCYLFCVQIFGVVSVLVYINVISSAKNVLDQKGIKTFTFSLFTIVSTFASCGFVPTNENMMVFSKNSGLLLILFPQILLGNNLYPSALRFSVWAIGKFKKKAEASYLLNNTREIRFHHFLSHKHSSFLVVTVLVFIIIQFILFSTLEWNSDSLSGLTNNYENFIGILFQTINTRHTGETIYDLSTIAAASLVLIVVMMYLPPYTTFIPLSTKASGKRNSDQRKQKNSKVLLGNIIFSQLSYVTIFIILVCITERKRIKEDPLNFNVLNIAVEVVSAYGNVGFTTGYNCDRRLKPDGFCENKWYGFSGKWSDEGKLILIVVMFFGRLKKFNMSGGKAWKLL